MAGTTLASNARLEEKINDIIGDLQEIKTAVKELSGCYQNFQVDYTKAHVIVEQKADAAHKRLDDHDEEMEKIKQNVDNIAKSISPLMFQSKILGWLAAILGASVITLIWGLITHTVTIVIP